MIQFGSFCDLSVIFDSKLSFTYIPRSIDEYASALSYSNRVHYSEFRYGFWSILYLARKLLNRFSLESLEHRRVTTGLVFFIRIIHYSYDYSEFSFHFPRISSRSQQTFYLNASNTNIHNSSPLMRM